MPERHSTRSMVLIHGAWQGSWSFDAWRPLLAARGWKVHAVDLPGNGWPPTADAQANLDTYTAQVVGVVRQMDEPVVVVGHSGGGITASQVAEAVPDLVSTVVYLAGMMLPSGTTYLDLVRAAAADDPASDFSGIAPWLAWNADRTHTSVNTEGALRCFVHDCEPDAARRAADMLRPQAESGRDMRNRLSRDRFGRVPRIYVECRDDRSVLLPLQRRMQALNPGATRISIDCGHVPQLACPDLLTRLLTSALTRARPSNEVVDG